MHYILPIEKFEDLKNQISWSNLTAIGIDERYLLMLIVSNIKMNGQIELDGSVSVPSHICLEQQVLQGNLSYILDDVRERFLYNRTTMPVREIVRSVVQFSLLLFTSIGNVLMEMIRSLQLKQKVQLLGLNVHVLNKEFRGIRVSISYDPHATLKRGFQYA